MLLRSLLALLLVVSATACAKKQPPPVVPTSTVSPEAEKPEATGSEPPTEGAPSDDKMQGDPCDGGE